MNLKEIRVSRKLKVQEVSDYLCCLPSVYSRYENGKREPSIDILLKLSKLYGVSVDYLIGNDEVVDTSIWCMLSAGKCTALLYTGKCDL